MDDAVRILVVDGDGCRRAETAHTLERIDSAVTVIEAATLEAGVDALVDREIHCIVSALDLKDENGLTFLRTVRERDDEVPFVLYPENPTADLAREGFSAGLTDYVPNVPGAECALANRIESLLGSSEDSGETTTQNRELARERERFSDLFSNFPEPTIAYGFDDGATVFKLVNDAFEDIFGYAETEIRGASVNGLLVPEDKLAESESIDRQVEAGDMVDRVVRRLAADGPRVFNLRSIPVRTEGEIDGFAIYSDITERKQRERELKRYETTVETIPMGVLVVDGKWEIVHVNEPGAEILGYGVDNLVGEAFNRLFQDGVITKSAMALADEIGNHLVYGESDTRKRTVEVSVYPQPDTVRELEVHASPLPSETDFAGVVIVFQDITDRKEHERELERQNERLEEFASIVSHDLRNPLTVAMGHLELVRDQHESQSVEHIADALDRMETLIQETLQLAKQGEMVTETRTIQLADFADACWEMIEQDEATLRCEGDVRFRGDPSRVRQLFENLFRNAVEHGSTSTRTGSENAVDHDSTSIRTGSENAVEPGSTDEESASSTDTTGSVTVRVGVEDGAIFIADDGPGIPADERETVFETGYTTSEDGTGFGLAIVKEIVDAHDWEIAVTESSSGGARFEIRGFETVSES